MATFEQIRTWLLEAITEASQHQGQTSVVLFAAYAKQHNLESRGRRPGALVSSGGPPPPPLDVQQIYLAALNELVRTGVVAWGYNFDNAEPPFLSLTPRGQSLLAGLGHSPANRAGYLGLVSQSVADTTVAWSYISEAVDCFNSGCFKATAVLTGGATEALILDLRDSLVQKLTFLGTPVHAQLNDWRAKTARDRLTNEFDNRIGQMPRALRDMYSSTWGPGTEIIRQARNDSGHPQHIAPITPDWAQANLLLFPGLAKHIAELKSWVVNTMT